MMMNTFRPIKIVSIMEENNMIYPKVQFKVLDIEENIDQLVWYAKKENSSNSPLDFFGFLLACGCLCCKGF